MKYCIAYCNIIKINIDSIIVNSLLIFNIMVEEIIHIIIIEDVSMTFLIKLKLIPHYIIYAEILPLKTMLRDEQNWYTILLYRITLVIVWLITNKIFY